MTGPYAVMAKAVQAENDYSVKPMNECQASEHDEQFELVDRHTGLPLSGTRYRIEGTGVSAEGVTDERGRTQRICSGGQPQELRVTLFKEAAELRAEVGEWAGCT
jgi:hypothetical protein